MAKKLPKDVDFAAGFFTSSLSTDNENESVSNKINTSKTTSMTTIQKNLGGRPKKSGLKNCQFTLTMDPEIYEKLKIVSEEYSRGNFSALVYEAIKVFCKENNIDLNSIKVDEEILETYKRKQEKKSNRKITVL